MSNNPSEEKKPIDPAGHEPPADVLPRGKAPELVLGLLRKTAENTRWRQQECINLIPSEMTASPMVRLASVMDPPVSIEHCHVAPDYHCCEQPDGVWRYPIE